MQKLYENFHIFHFQKRIKLFAEIRQYFFLVFSKLEDTQKDTQKDTFTNFLYLLFTVCSLGYKERMQILGQAWLGNKAPSCLHVHAFKKIKIAKKNKKVESIESSQCKKSGWHLQALNQLFLTLNKNACLFPNIFT